MTNYTPSMSQVETWLNEPLYITEAEIGKLSQIYGIEEQRLQRLVQQVAADVVQRLQTPAEPEPEGPGPTDEELDELAWNWYSKTGSTWHQIEAFRAYARAVLARWGNHPGSPDSSSQPLLGEVAELVAWLREIATQDFGLEPNLHRAADLLERLSPPQPIKKVSE